MSASPFARWRQAKRAAYRAVAGDLKLAYAQFIELESFAKFGTRLDDHTRKIIEHGQRIRAILIQPELEPASVSEQIVILLALTGGLLDRVLIGKMREAEQALERRQRRCGGGSSAFCFERKTERSGPQDDSESCGHGHRPIPARTRSRTQEEPMSDTLDGLRRKIAGAGDLESVVRSMKALAAASIGQYEKSVLARGLLSHGGAGPSCLLEQTEADFSPTRGERREERGASPINLPPHFTRPSPHGPRPSIAIVFGSDQGLVGQFNDVLADFVAKELNALPGKKKIWAVGERMHRAAKPITPVSRWWDSSPCRLP